jgi:[ribosomal protein S18]-alanine N-acetyltransferase
MNEIVICPMTASDLDQVLAIEVASYPRPWHTPHFLDELAAGHSFPLVALDQEGNVAGYICPMSLLDEGHILNVAVRNDCRGRGVGRLLVERAVDECRARGAETVSLEVRPSNSAAIALYRSLGFREAGRRKKYYENGEDAILMECLLNINEEQSDEL